MYYTTSSIYWRRQFQLVLTTFIFRTDEYLTLLILNLLYCVTQGQPASCRRENVVPTRPHVWRRHRRRTGPAALRRQPRQSGCINRCWTGQGSLRPLEGYFHYFNQFIVFNYALRLNTKNLDMNAILYYKSIWIIFVYRYGARSSSTRLWLPTWLSSSWKIRGNDRAKINNHTTIEILFLYQLNILTYNLQGGRRHTPLQKAKIHPCQRQRIGAPAQEAEAGPLSGCRYYL